MSQINLHRSWPFILAMLFATAHPVSAIDWPMEPRTQAQPLGNSYGEYQDYGGSPYLHPGIDVMRPAFTSVFAVKAGYVKAVLTISADLHWRVAIGDSAGPVTCDGWLYAHLERWSISVLEGEYVDEGDYLGELVMWPIANFHHLHFVKIRNSGTTWESDWDFIVNPLDELSDVTDLEAPVFETVNGGVPFAFFPDNTHTYYGIGETLSGSVDIIAHVYDRIGHPDWDLTPYAITYEVFNDTFSTGPITSVIYTGELFWDRNVNVTYQDDATYNTRGDYDAREYYFIVTNTDGDSVVESSDVDGAWHTAQFNNGDWWVKVIAHDRGGNSTADSMLVTTRNLFTLSGSAIPCDADPDSSGTTITAPDLPGAPQVDVDAQGNFVMADMVLGTARFVIERDYYVTVDTSLTFPGASLDLDLQPNYIVGDLNADGFPDALDLSQLIDILFAGSTDWPTPYWSGDLDFDRFFTALDMTILIDHVFHGAPAPGPARCYP